MNELLTIFTLWYQASSRLFRFFSPLFFEVISGFHLTCDAVFIISYHLVSYSPIFAFAPFLLVEFKCMQYMSHMS